DLHVPQRSVRGYIDNANGVSPSTVPTSEAFNDCGAAPSTELHQITRLGRVIRRIVPVDNLDRTFKLHARIERQHEAIAEERRIERCESLTADKIGLIE